MQTVIVFFGWCVLVLVAAMRFSVRSEFSDSERTRRAAEGDVAAQREVEQTTLLPYINALQFIIKTLIISAFITYCVYAYGIVGGVLVGTAAVLLVPVWFRAAFVERMADRVSQKLWPFLAKAATMLRPVLGWLRDRETLGADTVVHSPRELLEIVERSPGVMSKDQLKRLEAGFVFDSKTVASVMTPRSMIDALPASETLGPLVIDELYKTGHSRFPVYDGDLDHVVGVLYLHDLIDFKTGSKTAEKAMQKRVYYVHETQTLSHALHGFITTKHHLFVVVNQYRETVGLLSLEDVLEVLLGQKIVDEFDSFDDLRAVAEHNPKDNNSPPSSIDV